MGSLYRQLTLFTAPLLLKQVHSLILRAWETLKGDRLRLQAVFFGVSCIILTFGRPEDNPYILAFLHQNMSGAHAICMALGMSIANVCGGDLSRGHYGWTVMTSWGMIGTLLGYLSLGEALSDRPNSHSPLEPLLSRTILDISLPHLIQYLDSRDESTPDGNVLRERVEVLSEVLTGLQGTEGRSNKRKIRKIYEKVTSRCARCDEWGIAVCERCQSFRYCSRACQRAHWKESHRSHCFDTNLRGLRPTTEGNSRPVDRPNWSSQEVINVLVGRSADLAST